MKKINSIWYGATILKWGILFLVVIPLIICAVKEILGFSVYLEFVIKVSIVIGVLIFLFFSVLLAVELRQDKKINSYYENNKDKKIRISDAYYECQNCGYQKVKENEMICSICGMHLRG